MAAVHHPAGCYTLVMVELSFAPFTVKRFGYQDKALYKCNPSLLLLLLKQIRGDEEDRREINHWRHKLVWWGCCWSAGCFMTNLKSVFSEFPQRQNYMAPDISFVPERNTQWITSERESMIILDFSEVSESGHQLVEKPITNKKII